MVERNGVVDIADHRRAGASGKAAGQITAAHEPFQPRRRLIAQGLDRTGHRVGHQHRRGGRQPAHLLGIDDPIALQIAGPGADGVDGLFAGHHADDHPRPGRLTFASVLAGPGGAVGLPTRTAQPAALGQRRQCVGAALIHRPWIGRAHLLGELGQPAIKGRRGGGGHRTADLGHPVVRGADGDVTVLLGGHPTLPGGVGIGDPHRGIDGVDDPLPRPTVPIPDPGGQRLIELGDHLPVGDQIGAGDDQTHRAPIRSPLGQQRRHPRQAGIERLGVRHQKTGTHRRQVHHRGDLGGGLLETVDLGVLPIGPVGSGHPMPQQRRHRRQPPRHQHRLLPMRGLDHRHQSGGIRRYFEHAFDYRRGP